MLRFAPVSAVLIALALPAAAQTVSRIDPSPDDRSVMQVRLDEARVFRLGSPAQAIIVGNPSIADAVVHDSSTLIVTGRGFGTTNIIAIDRRGQLIFDRQVQVAQPRSAIVTVQRADSLETYVCAPECRPTTTTGDAARFFDPTLQQTTARNGLAAGSAAGSR